MVSTRNSSFVCNDASVNGKGSRGCPKSFHAILVSKRPTLDCGNWAEHDLKRLWCAFSQIGPKVLTLKLRVGRERKCQKDTSLCEFVKVLNGHADCQQRQAMVRSSSRASSSFMGIWWKKCHHGISHQSNGKLQSL